MKKLLAWGSLLLVIGWLLAHSHRGLVQPAQDIEAHHLVEILPETSFAAVVGQLAQKGLIVSPFWFRLLGKLQGAERQVKPGEYDLHTRMRPAEILDTLVKGKVVQYSILIPEGLTITQTAKLLHAAGIADESRVKALAADPAFLASLGIEARTLEGYLYPDTYYFPKRTKPEDVLKTMVARFRGLYTEELQARAAELKMTEREVLTLASIIEKETGQEAERPLIAAVFHNRLRKNWPLQSDPTVIYDIVNFDGNLTRRHLTTRTPSNTYMNRGLPPGPIANPGIRAVIAALHPAPVPYLFFVSKNDGSHEFSATLKEHNRAVMRYQKRAVRSPGARKIL